jgi:hypothetical protein
MDKHLRGQWSETRMALATASERAESCPDPVYAPIRVEIKMSRYRAAWTGDFPTNAPRLIDRSIALIVDRWADLPQPAHV